MGSTALTVTQQAFSLGFKTLFFLIENKAETKKARHRLLTDLTFDQLLTRSFYVYWVIKNTSINILAAQYILLHRGHSYYLVGDILTNR